MPKVAPTFHAKPPCRMANLVILWRARPTSPTVSIGQRPRSGMSAKMQPRHSVDVNLPMGQCRTLQRLPKRRRPPGLSRPHVAGTRQNQRRRSNPTIRCRAIAPRPNATFLVPHGCLHSTKGEGIFLGRRSQTTIHLGTTRRKGSGGWEEMPDESRPIRPQDCRWVRVVLCAALRRRAEPTPILTRAKAAQTFIGHGGRQVRSPRLGQPQRPPLEAPTRPPTCPHPNHTTKPHANLGRQCRRFAPQFVRDVLRTRNGAISGRQATSSRGHGHALEESMRR